MTDPANMAPSDVTLGTIWGLLKRLTLAETAILLGGFIAILSAAFSVGAWSDSVASKSSNGAPIVANKAPSVAPAATQPPASNVATLSRTPYYGYYGDLDKDDQPTIRQETLELSDDSHLVEGTSTGVVSEGTHQIQIQKTWHFSGQRTGEALALTFTTAADKNDPEPSGIGAYQLQKLGMRAYTGTAIFWDCKRRSFLQCPYVLSLDSMAPEAAKAQWPQVLGRTCARLDLTPDRDSKFAVRACAKIAGD